MFFKQIFFNPWVIFPFLIFLVFLSPLLVVVASLFGNYSDNWNHLLTYVLSSYVFNSLFLIFGVSIIASILGVGSAWIVSNYNYLGKSFFEWALVLPLAVPPYILAYTFTGLFDSYGSANNLVRELFSLNSNYIFFPNIRNIYGAIIVFSFTLYPYIYLATRMALINQSRSILEVGKTLGLNKLGIVFKLALPMIRPAIIAGLMLVIMETLSDFGAVEHFAIPTFTTGIFRTWYGLYDLQTAMQLSSLLLIFVTFFIFIERLSRKNISYTSGSPIYGEIMKVKLKGYKNILAFLICLIPLLVGFVLPILELSNWAINYKLDFFNEDFLKNSANTIYLAVIAAIFCTFLTLLMNFSIRVQKNNFLFFMSSSLTLGYAIPGLILAIGIMQIFNFLDNYFFSTLFDFVLTGSILGLVVAYIIKAYALSNSVIEPAYLRVSPYMDDIAKTLNASNLKLLKNIHLPLLKTSFFTSIVLVISEVIKELPATLILRPFNFDTLAVSTYIYASEERMYEAAAPSIAIVLVGLIPIYFLTKTIRSSRPGNKPKNVKN
ncbi:MAG: ABC transporter permease [Gammaproteobacteria bacterium]